MVNKKGQFQLSFGMIFSIILIISFIIVAFIVIKSFLDIKCSAEQGIFINDLQDRIDLIWRGGGSEETYKGTIRECGVEIICFWNPEEQKKGIYIDLLDPANNGFVDTDGTKGKHNLHFYPRRDADISSTYIDHVNLSSSVMPNNPQCYRNEKGVFNIPLKKNLNEDSIRIS